MSTLRVTNLKGGSAGSAPNLPDGAVITGVATVGVISATTIYGSGANLTGIDATALKDSGGSVKIQANSTGAVVTGVLTATTVSATTGSFTGNVSVGGTLTYEDVTNVDSVGMVTARTGIKVLAGGINAVGVVTATLGVQVGSGQSFGANGPTAVYYGDGSNLSGISAGISTTASSPSANTVVTLNLSTAQHHDLTLTAGITTITCSGGSFGDSHSVVISQPSSGIATVGFSTFFLFPSGSTPSMSEGGSKVDLVSFVVKRVGAGGTQLLASAGLNYSN